MFIVEKQNSWISYFAWKWNFNTLQFRLLFHALSTFSPPIFKSGEKSKFVNKTKISTTVWCLLQCDSNKGQCIKIQSLSSIVYGHFFTITVWSRPDLFSFSNPLFISNEHLHNLPERHDVLSKTTRDARRTNKENVCNQCSTLEQQQTLGNNGALAQTFLDIPNTSSPFDGKKNSSPSKKKTKRKMKESNRWTRVGWVHLNISVSDLW